MRSSAPRHPAPLALTRPVRVRSCYALCLVTALPGLGTLPQTVLARPRAADRPHAVTPHPSHVAPARKTVVAAREEDIAVRGASHDGRLRQAVQRTGASVTVLSAARLRALNVFDVRQLANLTPNLYEPRVTVGFSATNYFIRGIGELDPQGEPSVGTYIDGVYLPRTIGTMQELLDVDNVTIDRGPVGFDSGHQAEGGAVRINTTQPTNTTHLHLLAGYGTYNEYRAAAAVSGAIVKDKVFGSLSFDRHGRDGIDRNYTVNRRVNSIDYTQARGKLRFTPNERLEITLAFDGTADGSTNRGYGNLLNSYEHGLYSSIYPKNNYSEAGFTGVVNYRLSDHLQIHSISAVRGYDDRGYYDNFGTPYAQRSQLLYYKDRAYSEDLSLRGQYGRLSFTTGAYFMYEDWFTDRRANNTASAWYPDAVAGARQTYTPVLADIDQLTRIWALYAQAQYKITPHLTATIALRFNRESHSNAETLDYLAPGPSHVVGWPGNLATLYAAPGGDPAWPHPASASASWYQLLPKGALTWQALDHVMPYVSISQGSKSGGFDYRAQSPGAVNERQATIPYAPELITTYELGVKTSFLPHILQFNTALFYNHLDNIQMTTYDATTALSHRFNAGNGHSFGAEGELDARLTPDWDFHLTASYLYAQLDTFRGAVLAAYPVVGGGTLANSPHAGATLPYSPRFQGSVSSFYHFAVPHVPGGWRIGGTASYQSSLFTDGNENAQTRLPTQTYIDLLAAWNSPGKQWTVTASVRNLLNHRYPQSLNYFLGPQTSGGYIPANASASFSDPRTIFVTAEYRF